MNKKAFIFDLDGVIVDTAKFHFLAWKKLADSLNINFTHEINEQLKGVSRVRSLEIILSQGNVQASQEDKNGSRLFNPFGYSNSAYPLYVPH